MDSVNKDNLTIFEDIVLDSRDSGFRILSTWMGKPPEQLKKTDPKVYTALQEITPDKAELIYPLIDFALKTSFFYLLKNLEEGVGPISFELTMRDGSKDSAIVLISDEADLHLRSFAEK